MINSVGAELDMEAFVMTETQFQQIAGVVVAGRLEARHDAKLVRAASSIDRCDGSTPEATRHWLRSMDGWSDEPESTADFMVELAKVTTAGDLLDEIRRWTNGPDAVAESWPTLRPRVLEHFLSACEEVKLQVQLESLHQRSGETTPAYIRRFRSEAARAYPTARAASEESRVVAAFLRGFADRHFAEQLFRTGRISTLTNAVAAALEKEAERERMEQMLNRQGHESMEVGQISRHTSEDATTKLSRQLEQIVTRLAKLEAPSQSQKHEKPDWKAKRGTKGNRPDHRWADDGRPICNYCKEAGHYFRNCPARTPTGTMNGQSSGGH